MKNRQQAGGFIIMFLTFLPRHVRDEVLTRSRGCLVTFESRP